MLPSAAPRPSCPPPTVRCGQRHPANCAHKGSGWFLALTALGVVFGDIGTSPLYTFSVALECHRPRAAGRCRRARDRLADLLGADGDGVAQIRRLRPARRQRWRRRNPGAVVPGGVRPHRRRRREFRCWSLLGIVGAALLYGDGVITPAISVLSAMEGLKLVDAGIRQLRLAGHARDPDRLVHDPAARDREHRPAVRSGHGRLVRGHRLARYRQYLGGAGHPQGAQSGRGGTFRGRKSDRSPSR